MKKKINYWKYLLFIIGFVGILIGNTSTTGKIVALVVGIVCTLTFFVIDIVKNLKGN